MLKPISNELIDFIKTHISNKINIPKIKFSTKSKKLLSNIFEQMINGEKEFDNSKIKDKWIDFDKDKLPKGFDYDYSPEIARNEIESMQKFGCVYNFILNKRNIQVTIIMPRTNKVTNHDCNEKIKIIFIWLYIATKYSDYGCSQNLNIFIYLTDLKKNLPSNHKHILQENANTGFTTTCNTTSEIHIFRYEEWFKVLIHETFHNLGLDFSGVNNYGINQCVYNIFPLKCEKKYFETYCEMWAETINSMFISFLSSKNKNIENMIKKTTNILKIEREFSIFQCIKLLQFYDMKYSDLYENTPTAIYARIHKYKESTPVFSYYILKSIMMFFIDEYIDWCATHNQMSINFNKNPNNLIKYCQFIREHYKNDSYLYVIKSIENNVLNKKITKSIMETLRMTVYELQ
jgi:hypothetical protein